MGAGEFGVVGLQRKALEPIGESMSDHEVVLEIAKKLGLEQQVSEGKDTGQWIRELFENRYKLADWISWEEFRQKGYYVYPIAEDWRDDPAGMIRFYQDPEKYALGTPSGKLEFYSARLAEHFADDAERPPIPKWIEKGVTHDERHTSGRADMFPLLMISNHGRWRVHAQCDDITWTREVMTCKIDGPDGYKYEPIWIHPADAAKRSITTGDIVMVYNERGTVLCGALVVERILSGAVYVDHGARTDFIVPGKIDRGGAINLISPRGTISKNCLGQATSGYLVEVEKVSTAQMEQWRRDYPEAFEREYDPAAGLRFNAWVEGGME
jgi:anaerobic selenocysteine-containing dehydrogenase